MADDLNNSPSFGTNDPLRQTLQYAQGIEVAFASAAASAQAMAQAFSSMGGGGAGGGGQGSALGAGGQLGPQKGGNLSLGLQLAGNVFPGLKNNDMLKGAIQWVDRVAGSMFEDFRVGGKDAMNVERARLIARGGTGSFVRGTDVNKNNAFKENLMEASNKYNVQDRTEFMYQLANAYNANWAQGFGGGVEGERAGARALGQLSSLASAAGLQQGAVSSAQRSMYSSQTYYSAMATGINTRDARTGNMVDTNSIIDQYRQRLKGYSSDQIRRALAPGGMFRAELEQTWKDDSLVEMITEGILMTAETGKGATEAGGVGALAREAGYFGSEWTQGKDSSAELEQSALEKAAIYTNDYTQGLEAANLAMTKLNQAISGLPGPFHTLYGSMVAFGGAIDSLNAGLPNLTNTIMSAMVEAFGYSGTIGAGTGLAGILKMIEGLKSPDQDPWANDETSQGAGGPPTIGLPPSGQGPPVGGGGSTWDVTDTSGTGTAPNTGGDSGAYVNPTVSTDAAQTSYTAPTGSAGGSGMNSLQVMPESYRAGDGMMTPAVMPTTSPATKPVAPIVNIYVTVSHASDSEAIYLANHIKSILVNDAELERVGSGEMAT